MLTVSVRGTTERQQMNDNVRTKVDIPSTSREKDDGRTSAVWEAIEELAHTQSARSKTGQVRELFGVIEQAHKAGVSNKRILEALNTQGLSMSPKTFSTILHRVRKEKDKTGKATPGTLPSSQARNDPTPSSHPCQKAKPRDRTELAQARNRDVDLDKYTN